ncbi:MAG: Nodulation protein S (NodS) [Phormidesmis priestleyi Ana]|uniref:Nodulation protein S (NodS) n=1 Tax=Phormidesmis priestleyi Ana TaxID=1666911 RepID=A0A0N8KMJ1_9CYAN|nr:MAG: Nodulation protein S (NodS) [Phormidesmis priestleyi Ana]
MTSLPPRPDRIPEKRSPNSSLSPDYFEKMYADNLDPWNFETSEYEAQKYAATLAALPKARYQSAFEIGGSIGVLTKQLSDRCDSLLSVDVSEQAQARAKQRCQHLPQVQFEVRQIPHQYPSKMFDLTVVSEVGYYWGHTDLPIAQQKIADHLETGGHLLLVHWTPYVDDYPLTGDEVHEAFLQQVGQVYRALTSKREERYRLDLLERL